MTTNSPLGTIDACVFDAYGTLLDVNSAADKVLGDQAQALSELWRSKQLQYSWLRALMGTYAPFWEITGDALDYALDALDIRRPDLRDRLLQQYRELTPFTDVLKTLHTLRAAGLKTAILTNGSTEMIQAGCEHAGIDGLFDAILSVDDVKTFKPQPAVYELAVKRLGLPRERIAFLSSNGWDAVGAAHCGFRVIWCNRQGQRPERIPAPPQAMIRSLDELPELLGLATPT